MSMWLEVGGAAWSITDPACKRLYDLGARGIHCVVGDMGTYQTELSNITKYGMTPTLDIEIPLWVNTGMNASADVSWATPSLQAQHNAGWKFFSSEGLGRAATDVIRSVGPFINYGSENGANMYAGQYNHAADAHYANVLETYHKWAITDYKNTAATSWNNVKRQGLTLMMYAADLETDTTALVNYIKELQALGITISVLHMWCGINSDIQMVFNEPWISVVNAVKNNFGAWNTTPTWSTAPAPTPTPQPVGKEAQLNMWVVDSQVDVSVDVAMGGRLLDPDGAPIAGQSVEVMHYVNYDTGRTLVQDGEKTTDDKGELWYWFHGTRHYVLSYYLHFKAANGYKERWAGPLDIYVHQPRG